MLKNYLNVAIRNLKKHRFYSMINILGLSVGLTCFFLISLFIMHEISYDDFQKDSGRIYRMDFSGNINGSEFITALAGAPVADIMVEEFPEVEESVRLRSSGNWLIKRKGENDNFDMTEVVFADPNFFNFFSFELLYGDPKSCLERPNTLVLSETEANKIFGNEDPVGKSVIIDNDETWEVTGVFKDMPSNSHMHYQMIFTMESREESKSKVWMSMNFNTYLKLQEGFNYKELEAKFPDLIEKYIGPEIEKFMGMNLKDFGENGNYAGYFLFPLKDIHLKSDKLGELEANGDIKYVYIFSAIGLFILLLACINFMNLSTARSAGRAKEVGVRKALGALKQQLIRQFLTEAFIITIISVILAYILAFITLPQFNLISEKELQMSTLLSPSFLLIVAGVIVAVGFMAGSYPAFYLSKFKPVEVLKGKIAIGLKGGGLRSFLVVLQFTVSIVMIIGTSIVFQQLRYIQNKKLGFDKNQVLMVSDPWIMGDKVNAFKNEILKNTNVLNGTVASFLPVNTINNNNLWFPGASPTRDESYVFHNYRVDHEYLSTLSMEITKGRDFSREFLSDSSAIILNESAVERLGWTAEEAINKKLSTYGGSQEEPIVITYKIIGVVRNFHYESLRNTIEPLIFSLGENRGYVSFRLNTEDMSSTIDFIESKWDEFAPGQPFQYDFLDDRFSDMYKNEQKLGQIFGVFAGLAIFIACLGLYGLAAFTAEQKTKEIGVRKVLGASILNIVNLLAIDFLKLVGISFIIASILGGYAMNIWLQDFENRTSLNPVVFVTAGALAIVIAWVTMSFQSWNAARVNPVKSLKDE